MMSGIPSREPTQLNGTLLEGRYGINCDLRRARYVSDRFGGALIPRQRVGSPVENGGRIGGSDWFLESN